MIYLNTKLTISAIFALAFSIQSCVTSIDQEVTLNDTPEEDSEYYDALTKNSRKADVISNFENHYRISATYLSPEFRAAFKKRSAELFKSERVAWEESDAKVGFFISVFSPDEEVIDLADPNLWTIRLGPDEEPLKPVVIKQINDKERWRAFFVNVTPWTKEYLIVFDQTAVNPNSPELVNKVQILLTFANADAHVKLSW